MSSSLASLAQTERDELLLTIPLVESPEFHGNFGPQPVYLGNLSVINYSQVYSACKRCLSLPSPSKFRNGDLVQDGDYRGCGTFYAIWLQKGLVYHSEEYISTFKKDLSECSECELKPDIPETFRTMRKRAARLEAIPRYISRNENGPHNDGDHDCYLCKHPDEYGYSPSTAMSSAPQGYYHKYAKCDEEDVYFDPLLTHSKAYLGGKIAVAKLQPEYTDNDSFPNNYLGYYSENMGAGFEMQWIEMTETLKNLRR